MSMIVIHGFKAEEIAGMYAGNHLRRGDAKNFERWDGVQKLITVWKDAAAITRH